MAEETKLHLLTKLLDRGPYLLILLGVALFVLGLAGGITYENWLPIADTVARFAASSAGCALVALGLFKDWQQAGVTLNAKDFGIKIEQPIEGDAVDIVDVRGSIKKAPPKDYKLIVFRIYPKSNYYVPIGEARMTKQDKWEALSCNIGGKTGDDRFIGLYLVGPGGSSLIDYYTEAAREHRNLMKDYEKSTGKEANYLPLIKQRTPDMIEAHRVKVRRK